MPISLPYFVAPLSGERLTKTLVAHKARGFCHYITSPAEAVTPCSTLDLAMVLGVQKHFPAYTNTATHVPLERVHVWKVLTHIQAHWQRQLHELDMNWIHIELMQIPVAFRAAAFDQIETTLAYCVGKSPCPFSWRATEMKHDGTAAIPQDVLSKIEMNLASLEQALTAKDPMMPQHLRNIHSLLISYPETVHLLDDAEIACIIDAAEVHTKTEIVKAVAAKKSTGGRAKVSVNDL